MEGHGVMQVTAVGDATENGKVFEAAQIDDSVKTPPMNSCRGKHPYLAHSYIIGILVVVARISVYFINNDFGWMSFAAYFLQSVMIAVTLVVCSVPEGLLYGRHSCLGLPLCGACSRQITL